MGFTSANSCLKKLAKAIANDKELRGRYLRNMTPSDARKVSALHEEKFGIPGCLGCLDCMHVYWRTCPMAWKGHYQGKDKGKASIVLEGVADYNCWLWHSAFGPPGGNNDINIFDRSSLLTAMLDGTFTDELDFDFTINGTVFNFLWFFVDGIYPEIARFVKTISVPLGNVQTKHSAWQEGARKSVERAFGILQRKFQILQRPVELFYAEEIEDVVDCCVILHNMMVEVRVSRDEEERQEEQMHHVEPPPVEDSNEGSDNQLTGEEEEQEEEAQAQVEEAQVEDEYGDLLAETSRQRRRNIPSQWPLVGDSVREKAIKEHLRRSFAEREERWDDLYNEEEHFRLRDNIIADSRKKHSSN